MEQRKVIMLDGREVREPHTVKIDGRTRYGRFSDAELVAAGYTIEYQDIPEPEPIPLDDQYKHRVSELVRERYSQDDVEALMANVITDMVGYEAEWDQFQEYRAQCKAQARQEIYGE